MSYLTAMDYASVNVGIQENMYAALATEKKQHFVEWFSGSVLDSIWTFRDHDGTGSGGMNDAVNGGYRVSTGTTTNNSSGIDFNTINHYNETGSVWIIIARSNSSSSVMNIGTINNPTSTKDRVYINHGTSEANYRGITTGTGSSTAVSTGIAIDSIYHRFDAQLYSSSVSFFMDGNLSAISTTNLPTKTQMPIFLVQTKTTASATADILYMECYNT